MHTEACKAPTATGASLQLPAGQREISTANRNHTTLRAHVLLAVHCLEKTTCQVSFSLDNQVDVS